MKPTLLLTAIGKRVQLVDYLKKYFRVIGCDCSESAPARYFVDSFKLVPNCNEANYCFALLEICEIEHVDLLIPLYEPEFDSLASQRDELARGGTTLVLSDAKVLEICGDKIETARFFARHGISAPKTYIDVQPSSFDFPVVVKPARGMGSKDVHVAHDTEELVFFQRRVQGVVVQELVQGTEYTIDVLCDFSGNVLVAVPRIRLEVSSGEVVKSRIDLNPSVLDAVYNLVACLGMEGLVMGPLTLQCFYDSNSGAVKFIEVNPRLGGGAPLSLQAGACYGEFLLRLAKGEDVEPGCEIAELTMLRFARAVFLEDGEPVGVA